MSQTSNPTPDQQPTGQPAFDQQGAPVTDPNQPQATQPYADGAQQQLQPETAAPQQSAAGQMAAPQQTPAGQQAPVAGQGGQNPSNPQQIKDPEQWATGDQPMTEAQRSYLDSLAKQAGETLPANLTKAQASEHIDRLQQVTGVGSNQPPADPNGTIGA